MKIYCQHKQQSDIKQNGVYEYDVAILALSEMSLCLLLTPCIDLWQANYFSTNQQKPGTCFQAVFVHASMLYKNVTAENIHQKAILLREWIVPDQYKLSTRSLEINKRQYESLLCGSPERISSNVFPYYCL